MPKEKNNSVTLNFVPDECLCPDALRAVHHHQENHYRTAAPTQHYYIQRRHIGSGAWVYGFSGVLPVPTGSQWSPRTAWLSDQLARARAGMWPGIRQELDFSVS